jgi:hypothetical protein
MKKRSNKARRMIGGECHHGLMNERLGEICKLECGVVFPSQVAEDCGFKSNTKSVGYYHNRLRATLFG